MPKYTKPSVSGLLDPRKAAFVKHMREDPQLPYWRAAQRAGFKGTEKHLRSTAAQLMRLAAVRRALYAPQTKSEALRAKTVDQLTDAELGQIIKQVWLDIARSQGASAADRTRAATKLGETIAKFFVPVQHDVKGTLTMEDIVDAMQDPKELQDQEEVH